MDGKVEITRLCECWLPERAESNYNCEHGKREKAKSCHRKLHQGDLQELAELTGFGFPAQRVYFAPLACQAQRCAKCCTPHEVPCEGVLPLLERGLDRPERENPS